MVEKDLKQYLIIEPKDIFTVTKEGFVLLGDQGMTTEELKAVQAEIKFLEKTKIWNILTATVVSKAKEIMFEKAQSYDDMKTGKAILLAVDLQQKIVNQIKSLIPKTPKVGGK